MTLATLAIFASGTAALTYEILWQRQLFLMLGASAPATTAILTAIFLGIAFGSLLAVPLLRRSRNTLTLFAMLEAVIGIWGLTVPWMLTLAEQMYHAAALSLGEEHSLLKFVRFALAVIPLLPATLCMGATIPVMVSAVSGEQKSGVAWAYGINILGAVAGALATGLLWIRWLGMSNTRFVAVGCNVAAIAALLAWNRIQQRAASASADEDKSNAILSDRTESNSTGQQTSRLGVMYFAAGFVALGLEVVWLRFLGIVNTNSTVTFSLTLAVYLFGMGCGSLLLFPVLRRFLSGLTVFSFANGATALASLATFGIIYAAPAINYEGVTIPAAAGTLSLRNIYMTEAKLICALMMLPTVFMGLAYPAICEARAAGTGHDHEWNARAYFLGTLGSVAGILTVSLFVVPILGLHATFAGLILVSCVLAAASFPKQHGNGAVWLARAGAMGLIFWAVALAMDPRPVLRNSIAKRDGDQWFEYSNAPGGRRLSTITRFKAGASATVITKRKLGTSDDLIYVDDQLVASTNMEAKVDALMLAHLPLLLHEAPRNALTVGFGSGGTSHSMTVHGIDTYCVEIEPEVPRSSDLLQSQNFNVTTAPNFTLILNDARDHLNIGSRTYDVISTDVTNLQYKQNSSLYTVEYFQLMQDRLSDDGVACAWIPMAAISTDELRILMRSFQHVFPHATLWFMNHTHTNFGILIGTPQPLQIDLQRLKNGFSDPKISKDLALIHMTEPLQFVHCLHLDETGYATFCGDVPLHTDNDPVLEFSSPLSFYQYNETFRDNLSATLLLRPESFASYVTNADDVSDPDWQRHQTASLSFCKVLLRVYDFLLYRERNEVAGAAGTLKEALKWAEAGADAWPEDRPRQQFYQSFFLDADQWLKSRL